MTDAAELFRAAKTILLVDWPGPAFPVALVRAGYTVFGHEQDGYKQYAVEGDQLVTTSIDEPPTGIDIVNLFRPPEEQLDLVETAIRLRARSIWILPPEPASRVARELAEGLGLPFITGVNLAELAAEQSSS